MHCLPRYPRFPPDGTFLTADGPAARHRHPECTVHTAVHSWCCAVCGFGHASDDLSASFGCHAECSCCRNNLRCSAYSSPRPRPLGSLDLSIVSILLPFLDCHGVGIAPRVAARLNVLRVLSWHRHSVDFHADDVQVPERQSLSHSKRSGTLEVLRAPESDQGIVRSGRVDEEKVTQSLQFYS